MVEKLFATKNQHYVPRLLLRKFSSEGLPEGERRSISLLVLKSGRRIKGASIAGQCSRDYFYGTDGKLETALGAEETKIGSLIKDLTPGAIENFTDEEILSLRFFMHWQRVRTQGMVDQLNNQADALMKTVAREKLARETNPKIKPQDLELVNVTLNHPQVLAFSAAAKALPFILDLDVKFILAPPEAEFVLSDHPSAACNQFVENDPYLSQRNGWTGMAIKGIQMFLPISPQVTLAAYDPTTYEYGSNRSRICRANKKDVATLNKLQAITAVNNIYFRESFPDHLLEDLRRDRELQRPIREVNVRLSEVMTRPDGNESRLMSLSCVNFRLGRKFHFIKQLDTESYRNYSGITLPIRNKETYELYKEYSRFIEDKVGEKRHQRELAAIPASDPSAAAILS